jgi:hypothetical protein
MASGQGPTVAGASNGDRPGPDENSRECTALSSVPPAVLASRINDAGAAGLSNPALLECYKQAGMTYDPATKRWTMYSEEMVGIVRQDSLRQCMARATEFQETRFAFVRHYPNDTAEPQRR